MASLAAAEITDAEKWRQTMQAWSDHGYNPANIAGQIDWYATGIPQRGKTNGTHKSIAQSDNASKNSANTVTDAERREWADWTAASSA